MRTMFKAELLKLRRRRVAVAVAAGALAFAAVAATVVFLTASDAGEAPAGRAATVTSLGRAGGATEAFSLGVSGAGIMVLVLFIANVAGEFSQGTFRTLLMRQPRRVGSRCLAVVLPHEVKAHVEARGGTSRSDDASLIDKQHVGIDSDLGKAPR